VFTPLFYISIYVQSIPRCIASLLHKKKSIFVWQENIIMFLSELFYKINDLTLCVLIFIANSNV